MPALRRYQEFARLAPEHSMGITSVAFNPQGTLIATAGLDAHVSVWRVEDGVLQYSYCGDSAILTIVWMPEGEGIICGMRNGYVALLGISQDTIEVHGFLAHQYPVECLAFCKGLLATGAHSELKVWRSNVRTRQHDLEIDLSGPPSSCNYDAHDVLVTSLHWSPSTSPNSLVVTYMHHGVSIFDSGSWMVVRTFTLRGMIASASVSHDSEYIAISNLVDGFDVYRLSNQQLIKTFKHDVGHPFPVPITFIHRSRAILGGSTTGHVNIWDLRLGKLHSLPIPGRAKVLAVAGSHLEGTNASDYSFYVSTGVMNENGNSQCIIWKAEEIEQQESGQGLPPDAAVCASNLRQTLAFLLKCFVYILSGGIIVVAVLAGLLVAREGGSDDEL